MRTDLIKLLPNEGKRLGLANLFESYQAACAQMLPLAWQDWLSGSKRTAANALWKNVKTPNLLAGNSTILQAAERVAKGLLESHTGWLENDVSSLVSEWKRRKLKTLLHASADESAKENMLTLCHELFAINRRKAWRAQGIDRKAQIVFEASEETSKKGVQAQATERPATIRAYRLASKLFALAAKGRSLPDASSIQVELTRNASGMGSIQELPIELSKELALGFEASKSSGFGYWLKVRCPFAGAQGDQANIESILIPGLEHRAFHLRNQGARGPFHDAKGEMGYPGWNARQPSKLRKGLKKRLAKTGAAMPNPPKLQSRLNPGSFAPEAVESIGIVRKPNPSAPGGWDYCAAIRTDMRDSFASSRAAYKAAQDAKLSLTGVPPEPLGIDFGIKHLMATSRPVALGGVHAQLFGSRSMQGSVLPKIKKAVQIEGDRMAEREKLAAKLAGEKMASDPTLQEEKAKRLAFLELRESFAIKTAASQKLRKSVQGELKSLIGGLLSSIVLDDLPSELVVEELDFRGSNPSPEMNAMLSNCGRAAFEAKLKDLHEKYGLGIFVVEAAYTSQECSKCGHVEAANRQGERFQCKACGHQSHADIQAAANVRARRPCPGTKQLSKTGRGFAKTPLGRLPMLSQEAWQAASKAKVFKPALLAWIRERAAQQKKQACPTG